MYKLFYVTPNWRPGTQRCEFVCDCYGPTVTYHDPPVMYNIGRDPSETTNLDIKQPQYKDILDIMEKRLAEHKNSITPVPKQLQMSYQLPRPWLQECCNWPSCYCEEHV